MRELTEHLRGWRDAGTPFAVATVVGVRGSAPRQPGAVMAVDAVGEALGSVSGGCVEGAVYEVATEVLATGTAVLETYGISDDDAFSVGLTCGGVIDVLVSPASEPLFEVLDAIAADLPVALVTVLAGSAAPSAGWPAGPVPVGRQIAVWADRVAGSLGAPGLDHAVIDDARGMLAAGRTGLRHYGPSGQRSPVDAAATTPSGLGPTGEKREPRTAAVGIAAEAAGLPADAVTVFVQSFAPPPRMLVFGAIDYAAAVVSMGRFLGYRVTVCDARPVFATPRRFPDAHEVVCEWPARYFARVCVDERTVVCVLTHDSKFDVPLLRAALRSPAGYVGAMGSRRTHEDRLDRLRTDGLTDEELARLRSPIGLDIGGRTPEETAVSIAAEIIQTMWGGTGTPLRRTDGRIHGVSADVAG
ncbi:MULTISPECIES: XdhC/CoxI family protein [unclassified Pseudofrankia]|uniref:XdhC family protein n=1 Tax=unclassified Pseudofrankia TaxID=2994372 RepID=UPI0008DA4C1B|nr:MULTISPECIES: XdhC/CoxI family protein [unclassified Pseudofrankia]MDT3439658.1 XdhC family protein [Pseudofrankia sp. BMG5.37]OHV42847.1 xanthine dehydrogenase [Pseudofrankia sp. BMG5.36]